jgi:hypothetical protein
MLNFNMLYIQARYARLKFIADQRDMSDTILPAKNAIDNFNQYIGFNPFKWASSFITGTKGYSLRATANFLIKKGHEDLKKEAIVNQSDRYQASNRHLFDQIDYLSDEIVKVRQKNETLKKSNEELRTQYNNVYAIYLQTCLKLNSLLKTDSPDHLQLPIPPNNAGEQTFFKRNGKDYASYAIPRKQPPVIVAPSNRMQIT